MYVSKISPGAFDGAVELLKVRHTSPALILFSCLFSCHCGMPSVFSLAGECVRHHVRTSLQRMASAWTSIAQFMLRQPSTMSCRHHCKLIQAIANQGQCTQAVWKVLSGVLMDAQGYLPFIGSGPSEVEETRDDPEYVEWYVSYGQAYEQLNGQVGNNTVAMLECLQCRLSASMLCYVIHHLGVVFWLC